MHTLFVSAVDKLLGAFKEQVSQTPSHEIIQTWGQQLETAVNPTEEKVDRKVGRCLSPTTSTVFLEVKGLLHLCLNRLRSQNLPRVNQC